MMSQPRSPTRPPVSGGRPSIASERISASDLAQRVEGRAVREAERDVPVQLRLGARRREHRSRPHPDEGEPGARAARALPTRG